MKKLIPFSLSTLLLSLGSCTHYRGQPLPTLQTEVVQKKPGVFVAAKAFSKQECKQFLDRDVIQKGYQPIQLSIKNCSGRTLTLSRNQVGLPLADPVQVAKELHTSTLTRLAGFGAASVVFTPFFVFPAALEGYRSVKANEAMDQDFLEKGMITQRIMPQSETNILLFVPLKAYREEFEITLMDQKSQKPIHIQTSIR